MGVFEFFLSVPNLLAHFVLSPDASQIDGMQTANIVLDIILVAASVWMIFVVRGLGGIIGRSLTLIVAGAIVLGAAHGIATFSGRVLDWNSTFNNFAHRLIVLAGFFLLVMGFRQIREMKA
jgi:hypothetical protein